MNNRCSRSAAPCCSRKPRCLLLDEPTLGLAPIMVDEIERIIRTLAAKNMSILLVEQNAAMALGVADRAYVLESGRISVHGRAAAVLKGTAEVRQAFYLGA